MNNLLDLLFSQQPNEQLAIIHGNNSITYGQLKDRVKQAISYFQSQPSGRVGIHAQDSIPWVVALLGSIGAGNLVAPVPSRGPAQHRIDELNPSVLLTDQNINEWYATLDTLPMAEFASVDQHEPCVLLNSGGTTTSSRFITHSTQSMTAKLQLAQDTLLDSHCSGERVLAVAPLFSAYGTVNALMSLKASATLVIPKNFRPDNLAETIDVHKINYFGATPAIYSMMLKHECVSVWRPRRSIVAGDFVTRHLIERWEQQVGERLVHGFGTSEAGMIFIATDQTPVGALGEPTVDIQLRDGQLWIRSDSNTIGIWPNITRDEWVSTGDVLRYENEQYYFVGRASETFKVDGKDVDIAQIEQTVLDSGLIEDLVAVPAYDQHDRAHIKLLIVSEKLDKLQLEQYLQKCKLKAYIEHVAEIPRSPAGKKVRKPCYL